jgi:hypothetical protein
MNKAVRLVLGAVIGLALALGLFGGGVAVGALAPRMQELGSRLFPGDATLGAPSATPQPSAEELFGPFYDPALEAEVETITT